MAGHGKGDPKKVVLAALIGNFGIAIAKFVAAGISGSVTMLAEGVHSVADTCNQALLLLGMVLAAKRDPVRYPMGRAKETYFWAFVVALVLFFLGGVFAIYEGVHKLSGDSGPPGSPLVPMIVLLVSLALETGSIWVAFREFNRSRGSQSIREALFHGKDPTIPVVLLEDAGALLGLVFAMIAVLVAWLTGSTAADGIGSIVIGVLLCGIGVVLTFDTRSLLIGEAATPEMCRKVNDIIRRVDGVDDLRQLLSMHIGPESILLALKVRFSAGISVERVEQITDEIEQRIRSEIPQMTRIFVEADSDYDLALDKERLAT
jgi:cation diffusion facilitator family transporter